MGFTALGWSPDGREIAFVSGDQLYVIQSDGSNLRQLTHDTTTNMYLSWSPDSTLIAFYTMDTASDMAGIATVDIQDGTIKTLRNISSSLYYPIWQPALNGPFAASETTLAWELNIGGLDKASAPTTPSFMPFHSPMMIFEREVRVATVRALVKAPRLDTSQLVKQNSKRDLVHPIGIRHALS